MSNQNLFVRQTITVLIACGLIVGLLPGLAVAQDLSSVEARAAWLIGQYQGESINPNAKFGTAAALARLELDPNDTEVIDRITHFYDRVPAGSNGEQFSYPGVAWVLGKHWDKFYPGRARPPEGQAQGLQRSPGARHREPRHHEVRRRLSLRPVLARRDRMGAGCEHQRGGHGDGPREIAVGHEESLRQGVRRESFAQLRGGSSVPLLRDLRLRRGSRDQKPRPTRHSTSTSPIIAANHFEGVTIPPANRNYPSSILNTHASGTTPGKPNTCWIHWLYWADAMNWNPASKAGADGNYVGYAALSSWRPPAAIESLARGQTAPYELTASACSFGHAGVSPGFWGTGTPAECVRYVYRDKLYAMGSGFFQYYPDEYYVDYTAFRLVYKSSDRFNCIECYHPYWRSNDRTWRGLNSPFMQMAQHKGTAIALFNIPAADPWVGCGRNAKDWEATRNEHSDYLIQEVLVRYPKSIDQKTEASGWILLREGDVYIAIRPLKDYSIDTNYKPAGEFNVVRSAFAQTGFVFDIATKEQFATFAAFQTAVAKNPPAVDWAKLSVTYKSVRGDVLTAAWNPPKYDAKGQLVLVRPDITVNGAVVPIDRDFLNGVASMKSPSVTIANGVLRLQTPAGNLEMDWRGKAPKFGNQ
jgi:hypothetical protein